MKVFLMHKEGAEPLRKTGYKQPEHLRVTCSVVSGKPESFRKRPGCVCVCVCVCVQLLWVSRVCVCVCIQLFGSAGCVCMCVYTSFESVGCVCTASLGQPRSFSWVFCGPLPGAFQATLPKILEVLLSMPTTLPGPSPLQLCWETVHQLPMQ